MRVGRRSSSFHSADKGGPGGEVDPSMTRAMSGWAELLKGTACQDLMEGLGRSIEAGTRHDCMGSLLQKPEFYANKAD